MEATLQLAVVTLVPTNFNQNLDGARAVLRMAIYYADWVRNWMKFDTEMKEPCGFKQKKEIHRKKFISNQLRMVVRFSVVIPTRNNIHLNPWSTLL